MLLIVSNSLVLVGIVILLGSLTIVKKIVTRLPAGRSRKSWYFMAGLIALFVLGYLGYIAVFWDRHGALIDLMVPGIFFFGACFVWFSTFIALQTTLDVLRIRELEHESFTDPLTGIYNRRFMEQRLGEEISKAHRYDFQLSIMFFDLDNFKRVNDTYGHLAGDQVLIEISALVKQQLRDADILSRYGGEEFLIVAPNTGVNEAVMLADRLRARVEAQGFLQNYDGIQPPELRITVSIGLASLRDKSDNGETLIGKADRNLYQAKKLGRNRVVAA